MTKVLVDITVFFLERAFDADNHLRFKFCCFLHQRKESMKDSEAPIDMCAVVTNSHL